MKIKLVYWNNLLVASCCGLSGYDYAFIFMKIEWRSENGDIIVLRKFGNHVWNYLLEDIPFVAKLFQINLHWSFSPYCHRRDLADAYPIVFEHSQKESGIYGSR
jgi:hypothetical protein